MSVTRARITALSLTGVIALGGVACSDDADGNNVDDQLENDVSDLGDDLSEGVDDVSDEIQQQLDEGTEENNENPDGGG